MRGLSVRVVRVVRAFFVFMIFGFVAEARGRRSMRSGRIIRGFAAFEAAVPDYPTERICHRQRMTRTNRTSARAALRSAALTVTVGLLAWQAAGRIGEDGTVLEPAAPTCSLERVDCRQSHSLPR
jgi:hypothetical protein